MRIPITVALQGTCNSKEGRAGAAGLALRFSGFIINPDAPLEFLLKPEIIGAAVVSLAFLSSEYYRLFLFNATLAAIALSTLTTKPTLYSGLKLLRITSTVMHHHE